MPIFAPAARFCARDLCCPTSAGALDERDGQVESWAEWEGPLPHCQHDCLLPVRVKGRKAGAPQWGRPENGEWKDFTP